MHELRTLHALCKMADWAEVHRLAADFQRLQASSTAHKLSERNCVELVTKLVQRGLLEIAHTLDGKEYVTPGQLDREIRDELAAHGGDVAHRSYDEYTKWLCSPDTTVRQCSGVIHVIRGRAPINFDGTCYKCSV